MARRHSLHFLAGPRDPNKRVERWSHNRSNRWGRSARHRCWGCQNRLDDTAHRRSKSGEWIHIQIFRHECPHEAPQGSFPLDRCTPPHLSTDRLHRPGPGFRSRNTCALGYHHLRTRLAAPKFRPCNLGCSRPTRCCHCACLERSYRCSGHQAPYSRRVHDSQRRLRPREHSRPSWKFRNSRSCRRMNRAPRPRHRLASA